MNQTKMNQTIEIVFKSGIKTKYESDQYTDYTHNDQWFVVINGEQWIIAWYAFVDVDHIEIADRFPR